MSSCSPSVPQTRSHVSVLLSSLLDVEKEPTRVWLRAEMDRLVDPMLNSIFNRLTNKLVGRQEIKEEFDDKQTTNELITSNQTHNPDTILSQSNHNLTNSEDKEEEEGERSQTYPADHVESSQMHYSATLIPQPSTSYLDSHQPHSMIGYEPENDPEILAQVKREIKEEEIEMALKKLMDNGQQNQQIQDEYEEEVNHNTQQLGNETNNGEMMQIEEEDGLSDEVLEGNQAGDDDESRIVDNSTLDTTPLVPIRQSHLILRQCARTAKRKQTDDEQTQVQNEGDIRDDTQEEEKELEVTSRSVKRSRPSVPTTLSSTKQIITLTLQCPQCDRMFTKDKFDDHLKRKHSIGRYCCSVKDCKKSFDEMTVVRQHINQYHQSTSQWHCDNCEKHFTTYRLLSNHNVHYHQLGHFQCSHPSCTFTGEYRRKVYDHYRQHKQKVNKCQVPGCPYETAKSSHWKAHQRVHFGIKPFRCKFSLCDYASAEQSTTIRHIRLIHFARNQSARPNATQLRDPKDYLEVVHELL